MPEVATLSELDRTPHAEVFDDPSPRTVRLQLAKGQEIPPHRHPGSDVVVHLVSGELEIGLDDERYRLSSGQLVRFSGDREVSPRAIEACTAVVVFAPEDGPST